ncbi:MAG: manganese ABC transporter ATP-binding protein MntB [Saprospiraceae bacterium]|jgi:ABC-type Mn2+/Zn2+ transport system ATPase subunit|nr:manganese ABC transporter ATP-binding protein [Saprospirales bacterium]
MKPAISIKGLSVSYDRKVVLANVYLDIEPGNVYGIIGPNGAGKSTLFKAILGLVEANTGVIEFFNDDFKDHRKQIAYVPQRDDIDWDFPATVFDIVLMGRYPYKKLLEPINKADREKAMQALQKLGIENLKDRQVGELSGGQQQRMFIARALCQEASIYLLDEPFVGVDITTEEKIISILKDLAKQGKTLLVVHHDLSTVREYFDKVVLINQRLVAAGDTENTFTEENIAKAYTSQLPILHKIS